MVINFVRIPRYYRANLSIGRFRQNWGRRGERAKEKRTSSSPSTSPLKSQISSVVTPKGGLITQARLNPKLAGTTMEGKREETQLYSRHTEVRNLDFLQECPNYFASVCSPYASVHRPLSTNPPLKLMRRVSLALLLPGTGTKQCWFHTLGTWCVTVYTIHVALSDATLTREQREARSCPLKRPSIRAVELNPNMVWVLEKEACSY